MGDEHATSFGAFAASYAALRPEWPAETVSWLVGNDDEAVPKHVLDLGAGTGKMTETLLSLGHTVVAIDPSEGMLVELTHRLPTVEARVGPAEQIPAGDDEFDAVTVAQAWHWFEPEPAVAECARVLKPKGILGVAWHRRDERVPWIRELSAVVGRMESVAKQPRADGLELTPPFGAVEERVFDYELVTTPEGLRALADTWSYVNLAEDRETKLEAVYMLAREAAQPDGGVVVPHETLCFRSRLSS